MKYKKPLLPLLAFQSTNNKSYREVAEKIDKRIVQCFQSNKIDVKQDGYKISPVNMVFNYTFSSKNSYKSLINLKSDISFVVGQDVKFFQRDDKSYAFSISVPREDRSYVGLRDLLSSDEYKKSKSSTTIAVGIDELARNIVFDLAEAPHLLISGTTGSGKTVYLDDIILSILYKASPTKVKLVLIDSAADLNTYNDIPHLLFPVIKDKWDVYETIKYVRNRMNERFDRLAKAGVRSVDSYNQNHRTHIPLIVVIIDKYLDYTYEMPEDFENCIKEIARKGRAAGVHLIINAQTARSEVINSDIKANIPYRIAFSVTDWHESKAILDKTGAQKLLGNGDMLFSSGANTTPLHVQAPNVELSEVKKIVQSIINRNGKAEYVRSFDDVREPIDDNIPYVISILESLSQTNNVDVYSIQKMMDVDYVEASDIVKFLEDNSIISAHGGGNKGRNVDHEVVDQMLEKYTRELQQPDNEVDE